MVEYNLPLQATLPPGTSKRPMTTELQQLVEEVENDNIFSSR
jgi:hypothetical protein